MAFASPFARELLHPSPPYATHDRDTDESDDDLAPLRPRVTPTTSTFSKPKESPVERAARLAAKREARVRRKFVKRFRREELETVERIFHLMDADDSGTISKREMVWALQHDGEIHTVARRSALLRLLLKQHEHLETLFAHLKMSESRRDELSWDIFRVFCEEMYIRLMEQGLLDVVANEDSEHGMLSSSEAAKKKEEARKRRKEERRQNEASHHDKVKTKRSKDTNETRIDRRSYVEAREEALIRRVFQHCDQDRNGLLHVEELRKALYKSPSTEIKTILRASKALQPLLHQDTFVQAFCRFEPADPRGISEEEFVLFCLETAEIAALNGML
ncbi:hypothetical protein PINS_up013930 [Pythium insidiosum]|nr:hypothetical protein PINS_up013930 [Pythium insidiosum]